MTKRFVRVKSCANDWHAVKGGSTLRDRGMAAELREMLYANKMEVPPEYRVSNATNFEWYLNSVVHEDDDRPTRFMRLKNKKGIPTDYPYSSNQLDRLFQWAYQNSNLYKKPSWTGS